MKTVEVVTFSWWWITLQTPRPHIELSFQKFRNVSSRLNVIPINWTYLNKIDHNNSKRMRVELGRAQGFNRNRKFLGTEKENQ